MNFDKKLLTLLNNMSLRLSFKKFYALKGLMSGFFKFFYLSLVFLFLSIFCSRVVAEELTFGIDVGYGFLDIGADSTAQEIANISGSTVTATYDTGAWVGRIYGDYKIADSTYIDVGFFMTGDVTAKYTLAGATASESYSANGIDLAVVLKENEKEGFFVKGGIHSSTIDGNANVTISGTTYAAQATSSGMGFVFGAGIDGDDNSRYGVSLYSNLGGDAAADAWLFYYGFRF